MKSLVFLCCFGPAKRCTLRYNYGTRKTKNEQIKVFIGDLFSLAFLSVTAGTFPVLKAIYR